MENDKILVRKRIVKSKTEAHFVLRVLCDTGETESLRQGIGLCLSGLNNPQIDDLFERYPDLLQQYGVKEMLEGGITIAGYTEEEIKAAGLLSGVQMVLLFYIEIREQKDNVENMEEMLRYILGSVSCGGWIDGTLQLVTGIVGTDYYERFQDRIATMGNDVRQLENLAHDPILHPHINLMTWFCLVRLFLESVYTLYDIDN